MVQNGSTFVVMEEQQTADALVWTEFTPSLEDLGQAGVDVTYDVDCLPLLEQDRGQMTRFDEDCDYLFTRVSLNFLSSQALT